MDAKAPPLVGQQPSTRDLSEIVQMCEVQEPGVIPGLPDVSGVSHEVVIVPTSTDTAPPLWAAAVPVVDAECFKKPVEVGSVDGLIKYANEHDRDPKEQQTRADHLMDRIREGAPTLDWPPERNAPCWCASGRKYKKCCNSPTNR